VNVLRRGTLAAVVALAAAAPPAMAQATDSLIAAAQRAARAWRAHDFAAVLAPSPEVQVQLPGANPSAPLRAAQAAELLRAFVEDADELEVEVVVARTVAGGRAYVEIQRVFQVRGTASRRSHTVYLGLLAQGGGYRVVEVRVVP